MSIQLSYGWADDWAMSQGHVFTIRTDSGHTLRFLKNVGRMPVNRRTSAS